MLAAYIVQNQVQSVTAVAATQRLFGELLTYFLHQHLVLRPLPQLMVKLILEGNWFKVYRLNFRKHFLSPLRREKGLAAVAEKHLGLEQMVAGAAVNQ